VIQNGKNGFLVSPGDTEAMARYVTLLLTDDRLRATMSENGRRSVEEFSVQKMLKDYSKLYENISVDQK
jgi:glycosyltransferase involved in cell wall biosynthesis